MKGNTRRVKRKTVETVLLPLELIIEILLRLPVKSLIRFKTVCKSWFSLISDPHFAISHFDLAAARTDRIALMGERVTKIQSIDYNASLYDDSASVLLKCDFMTSHQCLEIQGSCRGFLLLDLNNIFCLWNPSTGVHKFVEYSPLAVEGGKFTEFLIGFGYDRTRDDYLVIQAFINIDDPEGCEFRLQYFSLRANVWEDIGVTSPCYSHFSYSIFLDQTGTLFNGFIHWLVYSQTKCMDVIVAFDLTENSLSDITMPDFDNQLDYVYLRVCGELLSLCGLVENYSSVEIWVMQEYRVESSWIKTIVVSFRDIPTRTFSPICSTKSGDIIGSSGVYDDTLVKCNDKGHWQEFRSYCDNQFTARRRAAMYTESLLSFPTSKSKKMANK